MFGEDQSERSFCGKGSSLYERLETRCRRTILGSLPVLVLLVNACGAGAEPQKKPTLETYLKELGYGVIELKRSSRNNSLFVEAELNGKSRTLTLDTGCSLTTVDTVIAGKLKTPKELGVTLKDPVLGELDAEECYLLDHLNFGEIRFENQPVKRLALKSQNFGTAGILGCDFLIRSHAILDCAAKRLYVRSSELPPPSRENLQKTLSSSGYHAAQLKRSDMLVPLCSARVNDVQLTLLLDSGAIYTIINESLGHKLDLNLRKTGKQVVGLKRGMRTEILSATVRSITLDGAALPLRGNEIGVGDLESWLPKDSPVNVDGLLGAELLAQSGALLDFQSSQMWFVPAPAK